MASNICSTKTLIHIFIITHGIVAQLTTIKLMIMIIKEELQMKVEL